jgi:hypothetical protein
MAISSRITSAAMKISMTPIKVTKGIFTNPKSMSRAIENALTGAALGVKADYGVTQQTWSGKSRGDFKIKSSPGERLIYTDSLIYLWVDKGTKKHDIKPKNKPRLTFRTGYNAKTAPNRIGSGAGGKFGGWVSTKKVIKHPGTKARTFSKVIAAKWQKELPKIVQRSIDSEL